MTGNAACSCCGAGLLGKRELCAICARHPFDPSDPTANEIARLRSHVDIWRAVAAAEAARCAEDARRGSAFDRAIDHLEDAVLAVYDRHSAKITADGICGACGRHAPCPTLQDVQVRGERLAMRRARDEAARQREEARSERLLRWAEERDRKIAAGELRPFEYDPDSDVEFEAMFGALR